MVCEGDGVKRVAETMAGTQGGRSTAELGVPIRVSGLSRGP